MYNLVICDDDIIFAQKVSILLRQFITQQGSLIKQKIYDNGIFVIDDIENGIFYDVYILDIEMPQWQGTDIAKKIRQYSSEALIIFVTSHMKYAVVSFEYRIFRYIPKSKLDEQLPLALKAAFAALGCQEGKYYLVSNMKRSQKVFFKDIIYIYKDEKNSVFVTDSSEIKVREPLMDVYEKLSEDDFIQIDRCYIVNIQYIHKVDGVEKTLLLRNKIKLNIAKNRVQEVKRKVSEFWEAGI